MSHEQIIAEKDRQIVKLQTDILELTYQLAQFRKLVFGNKSERFLPENNQMSLFQFEKATEEEVVTPSTQTIKEHERKKSKHKGRTLLESCGHLEVITEVLEVENPDGLKKIGSEITRKLAYKPGKLYVIEIVRPKYLNPLNGSIIIASPKAEPIPKCEADVSLLAHILVSKFVDHIPEYRLQKMFYRTDNVTLPPSSVNSWTHQIAPIIGTMANSIRASILKSDYIHMDETGIKVMTGKKPGTHKGFMWVILNKGKGVCFDYHPGRNRAGPTDCLIDYEGKLQTDGYSVYTDIEIRNPKIIHFQCMAHVRREFERALTNDNKRASYILQEIQKLYAVERKIKENNMDDSSILEERKKSKEILGQIKTWLEKEIQTLEPSARISKAIKYMLNRWKYIYRYTDYAEVNIDNNPVENAIRPLALGRKNYLFAGSEQAAEHIGHFYTIFGTCKMLDINPYEYLLWMLPKVATTNINKIHTLTPQAYLESATPSD